MGEICITHSLTDIFRGGKSIMCNEGLQSDSCLFVAEWPSDV